MFGAAKCLMVTQYMFTAERLMLTQYVGTADCLMLTKYVWYSRQFNAHTVCVVEQTV